MSSNKYRYMLIDSSYLLTRNTMALHGRYKKDGLEYNFSDIVRTTIWSIGKLYRDFGISADKIILIWDKYGADGYHRTSVLKGAYKDNRVYITEEDAKKETDPEKKKEMEIEAYKNSEKQKAKKFIIEELGNYGLVSFMKSSWEADDIAVIWSNLLYDYHSKNGGKSVIVSRDSDWKFWTNPTVDNFRISIGSAKEVLTTYDQVMEVEFPKSFIGKLSLYDYKSLYDSIEGSHNNMRRTRIVGVDTDYIIYKLINGEEDVVKYFDDYDLFKLQFSTFRLNEFEGFDKINSMFYYIDKSGKIGTEDEFVKFSDDNKLNVTGSYYSKLVRNLDNKLYNGE